MNPLRLLGILAGCVLALSLWIQRADARESYGGRSSRSGSDRQGRLSQRDGNRDDSTQRADEAKQREEELKKKEDARKEAAAKKQEEAKKQAEARAQKAAAAKAPKAQASRPAKGPGTPAKGANDGEDEKEAAKLCEEAETKFAEGKIETIEEGAKLLRQVLDEYARTEAAERAEARLAQLQAMDEVGPLLLLGEANDLFSAQRYRKAHNKYTELVQAFPESPQAQEANKRLAEIRNDDLLSKSAYTQEELEDARLWLLAGNIHLENSRRGDATAAWRRVVEAYPGCRYAQEAAEKLQALPKT